jgi:hypothetical protein
MAVSVAGALDSVDIADLAGHEARPDEVKDRNNDVGDLAHTPDRVDGVKLRMSCNRTHWCLDGSHRDGVYPYTALGVRDRERLGRAGRP